MKKNVLKKVLSGVLAMTMCLTPAFTYITPISASEIDDSMYTVTVEKNENAIISLNDTEETSVEVEDGSEVKINVVPNAGYQIDQVVAIANDETENEVTENKGVYATTVSGSNLTVKAILSVEEKGNASVGNDVDLVEEKQTVEKPSAIEGQEKDATVRISATSGGTVTVDNDKAKAGETVNVSIEPDNNYLLYDFMVANASSKAEILGNYKENVYSFVMPKKSNVDITATFIESNMFSTFNMNHGTTAITYNEGGTKMGDAIGVTYESMYTWMDKHAWDDYYIGTPYPETEDGGFITGVNYGTDFRVPNGEAGNVYGNDDDGRAMMNCTGFVWNMLWHASGMSVTDAFNRIPCWGGVGAGRWTSYLRSNNIEYRTYTQTDVNNINSLIQDVIDDGYMEPGDIVWTYNANVAMANDGLPAASDGMHHIGIYVGNRYNNGDENNWWNSIGMCPYTNTFYNTNLINQITPKTSCINMTVVKLGDKQPSKGYATLHKSSSNEDLTNENSCYSLADATYGIYTDKSCSKESKLNVWFTTDVNGNTNTVELDAGTYYVKEGRVPKGFTRDERVYTLVVSTDNTVDNPVKISVTDTPANDPASILLRKIDAETGKVSKALAGAEFTVKFYDIQTNSATDLEGRSPLRTWIFKTANDGMITLADTNDFVSGDDLYYNSAGLITLPLGTVTIQETKAPKDYTVNSTLFVCPIQQDESADDVVTYNTPTIPEKKIYGGVKISKVDNDSKKATAQGSATLAGAKFSIKNETGTVVKEITTNENGVATTGTRDLVVGKYSIIETTASQGYNIPSNNVAKEFEITQDGVIVDLTGSPVNEPVIRGDVLVEKKDKDIEDSQGDADLSGIKFQIINKSTHAVYVNGAWHQPNAEVMQITSYYDGRLKKYIAKTEGNALAYGTYSIKELPKENSNSLANESYRFTDGQEQGFSIVEQGEVQTASTAKGKLEFVNEVVRGGVILQKYDKDFDEQYAQGDSTLAGAEFTIVNESKKAVSVNGVTYKPGEAVLVITTDSNGTAQCNGITLPYGTYSVTETKASIGYKIDKDWKQTFRIRKNQEIVDLGSYHVMEPVIRGDVQVQKWDKELDANEALGGNNHDEKETGTTLSNIEFTIVNKSAHDVLVNDTRFKPGEAVTTITTHWNEDLQGYTAETTDGTLPYGTYSIQETKTNDSYLLTDGTAKTFLIRANGMTVLEDASGDDLIFTNQVKRGDFELTKIAFNLSDRMSVPFVVTNVTTGEKHVVVSDKNGEFSSESDWNAHSNNTNGNDKLLEMEKNEELITSKDMDSFAGVWFGLGENGSVASVDDKLCALPYGEYTIRELPCENNEGYEMQEFTFWIYRNNKVVDLDTITNYPGTPSIETTAIDSETIDHISSADGKVTIIDTVHCTNLTKGEKYTLKGTMTDADDEGVVLKVDGKKVNAETSFTAEKVNQDVEVIFTFDASELAGKTIVIFEKLFNDGEEVATHEDVDDPKQTVYFPEIKTTALADDTKDHIVNAHDEITVIDTVKYNNLIAGKEYTVNGILMNQETEKPIQNNGVDVVANTSFIADETSGEVELAFTFDASELAGQTIVAYEDLLYNGVKVATHSDIKDKEQSVQIPKIGTAAYDADTKIPVSYADGEVTVIDTVKYENLIPNKVYEVTGTLMDKETAETMKDADGKEITTVVEFLPTSKNGNIDVSFKFNGTGLEGKSIVVFEKISLNGTIIGSHEDISDEGQTVNIPKVQTEAIDNETEMNMSKTTGNVTITDTVSYTNLKEGYEYKVIGVLMDKTTGEKLLIDKKEVTSKVTFTPMTKDGTVDVTFKFSAEGLGGKDIVVFENLYYEDKLVAAHADLNDEKQTIHFPSIETTLISDDTNDHLSDRNEKVSFTDTVTYENVLKGVEYTIKGTLMNKDSNEPIKDADGKEITTEQKFTAEDTKGTITLNFTFDASAFAGQTIVAFENLYYKDINLATHADINDEAQSVHIPEVKTKAHDFKTEEAIGTNGAEVSIIDTVSYKNLVPNKEYTLVGTIHSKEKGDVVGEEVRVEFTPEKADGTVDVPFTFVDDVDGKSYVVFEKLYLDEVLIGSHEDINDMDQTIHYPDIHTNASDKNSGTQTGTVGAETIFVDTVSYENLIVGKEYTLKGKLMDKAANEPLVVNDKQITTEVTFTPEEEDGTIEVAFVFDTSALAGKTVVAFEDLYYKDKLVATHSDIEDKNQSVYYPELDTNANDGLTKDESAVVGKTTIVDVVSYKNLIPGNEYTISGILMDKGTGKELGIGEDNEEKTDSIVDAVKEKVKDVATDLKNILTGTSSMEATEDAATRATVTFVPETADGTVELIYEVDSTLLAGKTAVVFESLIVDGKVVISHADIEDKDQTVYFPEVRTKAIDNDTLTQTSKYSETATIVDTVEYRNLVPGKEYTVEGILMDKSTGEALTEDRSLYAESVSHELEVGTYVIDVKDNTMSIYLEKDGKHVSIETGKTDLDNVPIDSFTFEIKEKGEYTIAKTTSGTYELVTEKELLEKEHPTTATTTFTPETANGTVELTYTVDTTLLTGKTIVVFEDLYHNNVLVYSHADIEDADQSIYVPNIKTTATAKDTEAHDTVAKETTTIVDKVEYTNLVVEKEYTVKGVLMNKSTGKELIVNEKTITAERTFTPTESNGSIDLEFTFDSREFADTEIVVFEELYQNDVLVGTHSDLMDENQTVKIMKTTETSDLVQTGDEFPTIPVVAGLLIALMLVIGGVFLSKKKKSN